MAGHVIKKRFWPQK